MHKARPSYEYGEKLLKQMGWSEGKGLGKNEDGVADFIKMKKKMNTKGMGFNGVDDRWIEHQEDFDSLLSDLNDGKPAANEQKLISVEKRAFKVGGRVHYSKFLRGKDLSQKKPEELDAIIVVKRRRKDAEAVPEDTETAEAELQSGVQTHTSSVSYQEYFAERMKASRRRRGLGEDGNEARCEEEGKDTEYAGSESGDVKLEKKHKKRSKHLRTANEGAFEEYHEGTSVDHSQTNGTELMEDCPEQDVPRRAKKLKHKPSQDSGDHDQFEASSKDKSVVARGLEQSLTPAENCCSAEDVPQRTKKKSKHKPSQSISDCTLEVSSEQAGEGVVVAEASDHTLITPGEDHLEEVAVRRQKKNKPKNKSSQDPVGVDHIEAVKDESEHENWVNGAFSETVALAADSCAEKRARKKSKHKPASEAEVPDIAQEDDPEIGHTAAEGDQPALDGELSRQVKKKSKQKPSQDAVGPGRPDVSHSAIEEGTPRKTKVKQKAVQNAVGEEVDANETASDLCLQERSPSRKRQKEKATAEAEVHAVGMEEAQPEPEVKVKKEPKPTRKIKVEPTEEVEEAQIEPEVKVKKESKPTRKIKVEPTEDMEEAAQVEPEVKVKKESKPTRKIKVEPTEEMEEVQIEPDVKVKKESKSTRKIKVEPTEEGPREEKSVSVARKKSEQKEKAKAGKAKAEKASEPADDNPEVCIPEASHPSSLPGNCKSAQKRLRPVSECQAEDGEPSNKKRGTADSATPSRRIRTRSSSLALSNDEGDSCIPDTKPAAKKPVKKTGEKSSKPPEASKSASSSKKPHNVTLVNEEAGSTPESKPVVKKKPVVRKAKVEESAELAKDVPPLKKSCKAVPVKGELGSAPEKKPVVKKKKAVESAELAEDVPPSKKPCKTALIKKKVDGVPETKPAAKKVVKKIVKKETEPAAKKVVKKIFKKPKESPEVLESATPSKETCKTTPVKKQSGSKPESKPAAKKVVKKVVVKRKETEVASKSAVPAKKPFEGKAQAPQYSPQINTAYQGNVLKNGNVNGGSLEHSGKPPVPLAPNKAGPFNGGMGMTANSTSANNPADKPASNPPPHPSNQRNNNNRGPMLKNIQLQPWHDYKHQAMFNRRGASIPPISQSLAESFSWWFVGMVDKAIGHKLNPNKTCHLGKEDFAAVLTDHIGRQHRYSNWIHIPGYGTDEWLHKSVDVLVNQMRKEARAKRNENFHVSTKKIVWKDSDDSD